MHICFLSGEYPHPDFPHGGVGTFIQTLGRALVDRGIIVTVLGIGYSDKEEEDNDQGVNVIRLRNSRWKKFSFIDNFYQINQRLLKVHHKYPIDIIEGAELSLAFLKKIPSVKYIIRMHGGHHFFAEAEKRKIGCWKGLQEKLSFMNADNIVGVSQFVINHTAKYISFGNKKIQLIYYPIDFARFYLNEPSKTCKGRIFFAGTVTEKKGMKQLIQAMPIIKANVPEAHLYIAGRDGLLPATRKSYIEYLKTLMDTSIKDSVFFLGPLKNTEIPAQIELAEVCCYPSHMETFGIVSIEAMAMGKPVVFTKAGPGPEIVDDKRTGLLCDPLSPDDIAEKVIYMLKNPEEAREMGKAARAFVLKNFSIEKIAEQNIEFYQSLL